MANYLELNCLVFGDDFSHIFPVKIAKTESIGSLKKAIKEEKKVAFQHVDADALEIFKVSIPVNEDGAAAIKRPLKHDPENGLQHLSVTVKRLIRVFEDLEDEHIHVMVKCPPAGECNSLWLMVATFNCISSIVSSVTHAAAPSTESYLELNCLVFGDDYCHIFPVKIAKTESIGSLKDAIKEKKKLAFEHVDADALEIFKVSIPVDGRFTENIKSHALNDETALSPLDYLSEVFPATPARKHLHILVRSPPQPESACS